MEKKITNWIKTKKNLLPFKYPNPAKPLLMRRMVAGSGILPGSIKANNIPSFYFALNFYE
jgi:hypothetical protein